MLRIHTTEKLDHIEAELRMAAERHGGSVLAVSRVGRILRADQSLKGVDAVTYTLCFSDLYAPLLRADIRFATFLPSRVAVCTRGDGVSLEAISPRDYCRMLHRPEVEPLLVPLEETLRQVMEEAAQRAPHHRAAAGASAEHPSTEDQISMKGALPQRVDCRGTKLEELAGIGGHDSQGG